MEAHSPMCCLTHSNEHLSVLVSICHQILKSPELVVTPCKTSTVTLLAEKIKCVLKELYFYIQEKFSESKWKKQRHREPLSGFSNKRDLCILDVELEQIFIQLRELIHPRVQVLKRSAFQFLTKFKESKENFNLLRNHSQTLCDRVSSQLEELSWSDDSSHTESTKDVEEPEVCEISFKESPRHSENPVGEECETDLFNYDEMKRFVEEGAQLEERLKTDDEESISENSDCLLPIKNIHKDVDLEHLLDEYQHHEGSFASDDPNEGREKEGEEEASCDTDNFNMDAFSQKSETAKHLHQVKPLIKNESYPSKSELLTLMEKDDQLITDIDAVEQDIVRNKHWTFKGEISGKSRDLNSLLEVHLELPHYSHHYPDESLNSTTALGTILNEEDAQHLESQLKDPQHSLNSDLSVTIEKIVTDRIRYLLFDDVVRKYVSSPSLKKENIADKEVECLDFKKSQLGLADHYADDYTKLVLNGPTTREIELDKKCQEITQLFETIMYKIDALSCNRVLPKPTVRKGETYEDVSAIVVEDTIPCVMSMGERKAPEEIIRPNVLKKAEEMTQAERRALRRANKVKRKKKQLSSLLSGEISLPEAVHRSIHLKDKNRREKEELKNKRKRGVASSSFLEKKIKSGRLKTADLLAEAIKKDH